MKKTASGLALALVSLLAQIPASAQIPTAGPSKSAAPTAPRQPPAASDRALSAEEIAKRAFPSVVLIQCESEHSGGLGSGFVVARGIVATNYHVIEGMERGYVALALTADSKEELEKPDAKRWWISEVVAVDVDADLALVRVPELERLGQEPLPLIASADRISIGQKVYALGNPQGLTGTISEGIVSSGIRSTERGSFLQITAPISQGSSGGPIVNERGEVVGVAVMMLRHGQNLNFAVPAPALVPLIEKARSRRFGAMVLAGKLPYAWKAPVALVNGSETASATPPPPSAPPASSAGPSFGTDDIPTLQNSPLSGYPILTLRDIPEVAGFAARYSARTTIWGLRIDGLSRSRTHEWEFDVSEPATGAEMSRVRKTDFYFTPASDVLAQRVLARMREYPKHEVRFDFEFRTGGPNSYYGRVTAVYWLDKDGGVIAWADDLEF